MPVERQASNALRDQARLASEEKQCHEIESRIREMDASDVDELRRKAKSAPIIRSLDVSSCN